MSSLDSDLSRRRWKIIALLMAYTFLCHFNRVSMSVAGTERLMSDYTISKPRMGMVYSAYLVVYTLCMTPGGWLIDRYGPKRALVGMGFGSALFVALTGGVGLLSLGMLVWPALLIVRSAAGFFSAPIHPACAGVVSRWMPWGTHALGNGLVTGAAFVGIASTYYVFGTMMDAMGWPASFAAAGLLTAALALVWTLYASDEPPLDARGSPDPALVSPNVSQSRATEIEDMRSNEWHSRETVPKQGQETVPEQSDSAQPWHTLLKDRSLVLLTISYAAVGYFEYLFFYWMQFYFEKVLNLGTDRGRLYSTIATLAMALGMYGGGQLAVQLEARFGRRVGRMAVPVCGMVASAIFLGIGIVTSQPEFVLFWFSAALASVGASEGPCWTTAVELGRGRGGTSAGIFNTGGNLGGVFAPVLTPVLSEYLGWKSGLALASVFCLLGAGLWFWIDVGPRDPE